MLHGSHPGCRRTATHRPGPAPAAPRRGRDAFGYGYSGGGPASTYGALRRAALGIDSSEAGRIAVANTGRRRNDQPESQLWRTISTTSGPLRLSWPQVKLWARVDRNAAKAGDAR